MKKILLIILGVILCGSVLYGCSGKTPSESKKSGDTQSFQAEIIETGDSLLVAPDKDSNEFKSSDKISAGLADVKITDNDGKEISADKLAIGDIIKITYNGTILESYPAQISASEIRRIGHNNLIDGYMALIDDIYPEDSGLNSEITVIAFDTTGWTDLTDIEKELILSLVKEKYSLDTIQGTFDELAEQGLIDKDNLYFKDGILIEIKNMNYDEKDNKITCSISKWRSGLGSIGWDAKARFDGTKWKITRSKQWIS